MRSGAPGTFGVQLKKLREAAGFTQEELATIAGLSVHAVSALERGQRQRPQVDTVRALSAALDLTAATREQLLTTARTPAHDRRGDAAIGVSLPLALTRLVGRDEDVKALRQWLADSSARLITLTGPGGAGKTRLALEIARQIAADGAARVLFVPLAAIRDAAFVALAIAEALGLLDITAVDLARRARASCDGTPTWLVLDNFEQVLDAGPLVAELLSSVADLRVLVTSRAPLRVRGEREFGVGPLALDVGADAASPGDPACSPAVRLFVDRVRDVQPGFLLTPANIATVTAICRRLDALPLALELAAPWLKVLSPQDLLLRLADDALLSTVAPRDLPERQQTMNATVAWSYQLLDAGEQRVFRRLGVLPGRFSIEGAAAVVAGGENPSPGIVLAAAAGLIDKSLLLRAETSLPARPLYRMLETVRAYAALELDAAGERDYAMEGLARYGVNEAQAAAAGITGPAQGEWLDRVRDDLDTYRRAMAWLIEQRRPSEATAIVYGLLNFWVIRGHTTEGLDLCERTLALTPLPPEVECRALVAAASLRYVQGKLDGARRAVERALAFEYGAAAADWLPQAELILGHVEHAGGNAAPARERFSRCLAACRGLPRTWQIGNALSGMAWVASATGDFDEADRLLDEATAELQDFGSWFQLLNLHVRAILAVRRGNADEAIVRVRESLFHIRRLHDTFAFVYALAPLATAASLKGDHAWAARILGARDAITDLTGATAADKSIDDLQEAARREGSACLGPDRWARAYAAGRTASIDSLIDDIDSRRG
jgi:predicted ATPase/DNA-binding XRE family transcriptional regulator